ncbi:cytochrome b6 [Desulfuromonas soudanensis]|uniref:Cytochrome b6 n=1 Tax=Desulfuromonas soudanensis TaxID=1603606 RepID=A0A0M4DJD9_9BACT|nr:Rieske 2Fe-2S domain-containing protein [Desulfuromonas soudanensis]ALC17195.1 cytochrome b6 [Desulfuromonas soudanensis]
MEEGPISPSRRRFFLSLLLAGIGAVLSAAALWPLWRYLSPRAGRGEEEKMAMDRNLVPVGGAHFFQFSGHPAVLLQNSPGSFLAFSAVCTHLGCIIQWQPEKGEFLCPCHAGRFSSTGAVLAGPPPKPLESIPVTLSGDQVLVG